MNISTRSSNASQTKHRIAKAIFCGLLLVLPSCCNLPGVHLAEPAPGLPPTYSGAASADSSARVGVDEFYRDPILTHLIHQGLAGNRELKALDQEIQVANSEVLLRQGAYLPFVTFGASAEANRPSRYTFEGAVEKQLDILPGKPFPDPLPDFRLGLNFLWELDIWRELRNARDAAAQRYIAAVERRNYFVTRLVADIAENYYRLVALDKRLEILDQTITLQQQSLELSRARMEAGRSTVLPVQRFEADVRKNQSEKLIVRQEIVEVENRINFLINRFPEPVTRMSAAGFFDLTIHPLCVGVPPQLLLNRPDIRQAERELIAAGLEVKSARARFFPRVTLRGAVGFEAFDPQYLFRPDAIFANAAGDLVAPLVNRKAIQAAYLGANARQLQSVYNYQRVVLNAFVEVVNRVSRVEKYGKSIEIKKRQLESLNAAVETANQLFQKARIEYGDVLFSLRDLLEARMVLIETKSQQLSAVVNAYQALGGGDLLSIAPWDPKRCNPPTPNPLQLPAVLPAVDPAASKPKSDDPAPSKPKADADKDMTLPAPRKTPPEPEKVSKRQDPVIRLHSLDSPAAADSQILIDLPPLSSQPHGVLAGRATPSGSN